MVTAVVDVEQGDCWTAPSVSENFIASEATNVLLSMGRILKSGWRLEYDPRISAEEQTRGAQHCLTVSSMVLVSPDGRAKARIFCRNSCCLFGRISVVRSGHILAFCAEFLGWRVSGGPLVRRRNTTKVSSKMAGCPPDNVDCGNHSCVPPTAWLGRVSLQQLSSNDCHASQGVERSH